MAAENARITKDTIRAFVDEHFEQQVALLSRLVQCPSDNPPGDCAAHAHGDVVPPGLGWSDDPCSEAGIPTVMFSADYALHLRSSRSVGCICRPCSRPVEACQSG